MALFGADEPPGPGLIASYTVVYKGGHPDYPKAKTGAIEFRVYGDHFDLLPTTGTKAWFSGLSLPFDTVGDLQVVERQVGSVEGILGGLASRQLNQANNLHISYRDESDRDLLLRLEMLTGITVMGQATKCREFEDLLRVHRLRDRFRENGSVVSGQQAVNADIPAQIESLAGLRDKGILTAAEFEEKKAELLSMMGRGTASPRRPPSRAATGHTAAGSAVVPAPAPPPSVVAAPSTRRTPSSGPHRTPSGRTASAAAAPAASRSAPASSDPKWFVDTGTKIAGPFPGSKVRDYLASGKIKDTMLVSTDRENWLSPTQAGLLGDAEAPEVLPVLDEAPAADDTSAPTGSLASAGNGKDRNTAGVLAIFLGGFGIHHFYLGANTAGLIQLGVTFCTCGFGAALAWIEAVILLSMDQARFDAKYNQRTPDPAEFSFSGPVGPAAAPVAPTAADSGKKRISQAKPKAKRPHPILIIVGVIVIVGILGAMLKPILEKVRDKANARAGGDSSDSKARYSIEEVLAMSPAEAQRLEAANDKEFEKVKADYRGRVEKALDQLKRATLGGNEIDRATYEAVETNALYANNAISIRRLEDRFSRRAMRDAAIAVADQVDAASAAKRQVGSRAPSFAFFEKAEEIGGGVQKLSEDLSIEPAKRKEQYKAAAKELHALADRVRGHLPNYASQLEALAAQVESK